LRQAWHASPPIGAGLIGKEATMTDSTGSRLWPLALMTWLATMPALPREAEAPSPPDQAEMAEVPPAPQAPPEDEETA
jgi:hypothetical protein